MKISEAAEDDLKSILELQYKAFQSEAERLNDFNIQPLKQSLSELTEEFRSGKILKALAPDGVIIGSVRCRRVDRTVYVGKLIVHPAYRRRGIGRALLSALESCYLQDDVRLELFTDASNAENIHLYRKQGYQIFGKKTVSPALTFALLEKNVPKHDHCVRSHDSTKFTSKGSGAPCSSFPANSRAASGQPPSQC